MDKRFDFAFALKEYEKLSFYMKETGFRCEPSGSLRRKNNDVGDIDFVVEGDEEAVLKILCLYPQIEKQINKYEFLLKSGIGIHAIPEKKSKYTYTLWHSTGPKSHVRYIEKIYMEKGIEIAEENICEEDVYRKIGLKYIRPEDRYRLQEKEND